MALDPFTQVLNGLWATLEAWAPFTELVKAGNRIKLDTHGEKTNLQDADLPQVRIEPTTCDLNLNATSTGHMITQAYAVEVNTASRLPRAAALPIKWAVIQAIANANADPTNPIDGMGFVRAIAVEDTTEGDDADTQDMTRPGWTVVLNVAVQMYFDDDTMAAAG